MKRGPKPTPIMDRIFARLEWCDDCLIWTGPVNNMGYGTLTRPAGLTRLVHRIVALHHGPVKPTEKVLHSCDTPRCCNPAHLRAGTQAQNIRECIERGRFSPRKPLERCKRDHEFTEANTLVRFDATGKRFRHCKTCAQERGRRHRQKQKAKLNA